MAAVTTHRQPLEYLGGVRRFPVSEDKVPWSKEYPEYQPVDYTAPRVVAGPAWADPDVRLLARQQCICAILYIGDDCAGISFNMPLICSNPIIYAVLSQPLPIDYHDLSSLPLSTAGSSHQRNRFNLTHSMGK